MLFASWYRCRQLVVDHPRKPHQRIQHRIRLLRHQLMPGIHLHHLAVRNGRGQQLGRARRRHHVAQAEDEQGGAAHRLGGGLAVGVGVAGEKVRVEHLRRVDLRDALLEPHGAAHGVEAGAGEGRLLRDRRVRPDVDHVDGGLLVAARGFQQRVGHLHRVGRAQQAQLADPLRRLVRGLQRDQRAHAVAEQRGLVHAGGVEQLQQPGGQLFDAGLGGALAAAVAGQVDGQHAKAVVGEVAALQRPHGVVVLRAVEEDDGGQGGVEGLAAGVAIGVHALHGEQHVSFLSGTV